MSKSRDLADLPAGGGDINIDDGTLFVDASEGNVGIGTNSPSFSTGGGLQISRTGQAANFSLQRTDGIVGEVRAGGAGMAFSADPSNTVAGTTITFQVDGTERMRIDSSGNVGIGTTSPAAKLDIRSDGAFIQFTHPTYGDVGKINATGDNIAFDATVVSSVAGIGLRSGRWTPRQSQSDSDNAIDLGASGTRFDDLYATNGTIQTSDRNEKQDIEALTEAEQRVAVAAKSLMRKFRWKSAVEKKGDDARIHFGIIAQDLQAAFEAEGLDAGRYAMFIYSEWWETYTDVPEVEAVDAVYETVTDEEGNETQVLVSEAVEAKEAYTRTDTYDTEEDAPEGAVKKSRMGVRYSELLAFIIAAI
jgi:hypothetical protein